MIVRRENRGIPWGQQGHGLCVDWAKRHADLEVGSLEIQGR